MPALGYREARWPSGESARAGAGAGRARRQNRLPIASSPANECQQQVLDPELPLNLPARGAQREARSHLRRAPQHAHQRETGKIGAGDQQNESGCQHQRQDLRAQRSCLALLERHGIVDHLGARVVLEFIAIGAEGPGAVDLGICLLPGRAVAQAGDGLEVCSAAFAVVGRLKRRVDVGVQGRHRPRRGAPRSLCTARLSTEWSAREYWDSSRRCFATSRSSGWRSLARADGLPHPRNCARGRVESPARRDSGPRCVPRGRTAPGIRFRRLTPEVVYLRPPRSGREHCRAAAPIAHRSRGAARRRHQCP